MHTFLCASLITYIMAQRYKWGVVLSKPIELFQIYVILEENLPY